MELKKVKVANIRDGIFNGVIFGRSILIGAEWTLLAKNDYVP